MNIAEAVFLWFGVWCASSISFGTICMLVATVLKKRSGKA